ncbi:CGNR zinc finger domain-containing protein [Streptomyces sp. NPDC056010]|uniref:CGNR zinc finger domain-containing protein n=1 Tax=unclassified Streptomyces TaxID=2593676 RepID=UPI0035DC13B7
MTTHGKDTLEIRPLEPLAVEFTSSWHYEAGALIDEVGTPHGLAHWIDAYRPRLGMGAGTRVEMDAPDVTTALAVREAVRDLLDALVDRGRPPAASLDLVTERARGVQQAAVTWPDTGPRLEWPDGVRVMDVVAAQVCASATRLLTSPRRELLRRCPAPSCVLFFSALRTGQQWCSPACGNRARVARHSARAR